jgi:predicted AAA+ superfamily ATPase
MMAAGKDQFVELLEKQDFAMIGTFKQEYIDLLKHYYFVGGMPEAVLSFVTNRDLNEVREVQNHILAAYEQDFSKHAPNEVVPRIRMLWNSIPAQLAKENKKFFYGVVKEGARAREYEYALMWLTDCGLAYKVHRVSAPKLPLKAYEDLKAFKLFLADVGLLSCMVRLKQDVLLDGNNLFVEFKGALTEQFVLQQLKTLSNIETYYWTNERNSVEVDFLLDMGNKVVPLEVTAEVNLKSKSLRSFAEKYHPDLSIRASMADYEKQDWLINIPLYAIGSILSSAQYE